MRLLVAAAVRQDVEARIDRVHDARASQMVDGRKVAEYVRTLERATNRQRRPAR